MKFRNLKTVLALVLAAMMLLGSSVAFAAGETTYTISVDTSKDTNAHTYKIYQIFTGTPSTNDEGEPILTDVQYGSSYPGGTTGSVPLTTLEGITNARTWASDNKDNLGAEVATLGGSTTSYTAVPGWYLVLDMGYTQSANTKDAVSAFMVKIVNEDTEFTPKKSVPSVDKEVQDEVAHAEAGATDGWGDTADHEIGKSFQFKLTATIPAGDYSAYSTYKLIFTDTMSAGITFENLESVKIDGTDNTDYVKAGIEDGDAGAKTWTLTWNNVPGVAGQVLNANKVVEVIYNAHLNDDAAVNTATGTTTNNNSVKLTYSNNPDSLGEGQPDTDTTPEDHVWVFTYGNTGTKVDKNNQPVAGAGFVLYKIDAANATTIADSKEQPTGTVVPLYKNNDGYFVYDSTNASAYEGGAVVDGNEIVTTAEANVFAIKGLDVGTYALYEKTVPTGYIQAKNTVFTISATHSETSDVGNVDMTGSQTSEDIINETGVELPETGGIGTTIFYVAGSILVLAAAILLITKRRMGAND